MNTAELGLDLQALNIRVGVRLVQRLQNLCLTSHILVHAPCEHFLLDINLLHLQVVGVQVIYYFPICFLCRDQN